MFSGENSIPVFTAAGGSSSNTASIWCRSILANTVRRQNPAGILRGEAGDGARAVDAERGERFQIGLDARAAAAVGAGDGQCHGQSFSRCHNVKK